MYVRRAGTAGPALVLLHAFPFDGRLWAQQLADLSSEYLVFAPDFPGFGNSPPAAGNFSLEMLATCVTDAIAALGAKRATVAGCSVGGRVALAMWRQLPRFVRALAFLNSRLATDDEQRRASRYAAISKVEREGVRAVAGTPPPVSPLTSRERPEVIAGLQAMASSATARGVITLLQAMAQWTQPAEELKRIDVPASVIFGLDDPLMNCGEAEATTRAIPGAEFVPIEGAGHLPSAERPDAVTAALRALLDRARLPA